MSIPEKSSNEFYETRNIYAEYIGYTGELNYDDWMNLPDDHKAAALYVRFFYPILDAWHKTRYLSTPEDSIDILCQYLLKQVDIIKIHPERYSEGYIHTVAFNCMYCENYNRKKDKDRARLEFYESDVHYGGESSNEDNVADEEEFAYYPDTSIEADLLDELYKDVYKIDLWNQIEELGEDALKIAEELSDGKKLRGIRGFNKEQKEIAVAKLMPILTKYKEQVG